MSNSFAFGGINAALVVGQGLEDLRSRETRAERREWRSCASGRSKRRISREVVLAYARATALDSSVPVTDEVPATFPAVWLCSIPPPRGILSEAANYEGRAPVLTAQRFEYRALGPRDRVMLLRVVIDSISV